MKIDLQKYELISKIAVGSDLKLILQNKLEVTDRKVLQLDNVVGFFDFNTKKDLVWLRIDDNGVYNLDLSMRLKRPEIQNFKDVFLFTDFDCVDFNFRAATEYVIFRDWTDNDKWLK